MGVSLAVKLCRQALEELLLQPVPTALRVGYGLRRRGESAEHLCIVLDEDAGYGLGGLVIDVQASDVILEGTIFYKAKDGEAHRDTEHDDTQTADRGHEFFSILFNVVGLECIEGCVEILFLLDGEAELEVVVETLEYLEQVLVVRAQLLKVFVQGGVHTVVEYVVPDEPGVQVVEREAAEEAVLGIGDEVEDLPRCAGEQRGQLGMLDVDVLTILAANI